MGKIKSFVFNLAGTWIIKDYKIWSMTIGCLTRIKGINIFIARQVRAWFNAIDTYNPLNLKINDFQ